MRRVPPVPDDFRSILDRAQAGEREALDQLLQRHLHGLRAFVRVKAGAGIRAQESCSDLVQSICREVLEDVGEVECEEESDFKRWLYSVALNKIHRRARHHGAQKRDVGRQRSLETDGDGALLDCYATLCTPSRHAVAREEVERIEAAIDALPEDYREVLLEARLVGRSHREIAAHMGRTEVAVRKLLTRARARLALLLQG